MAIQPTARVSFWQIVTIRRFLDAMLVETGVQKLNHELLVTLMSEVAAIVYSRPITAIPSDTHEPILLTTSRLLAKDSSARTASRKW